MLSLDTREKRAAHAGTAEQLRVHVGACVECSRAKRERDLSGMCPAGWRLHREEKETAAAAREAARLDAQPHPDQVALF